MQRQQQQHDDDEEEAEDQPISSPPPKLKRSKSFKKPAVDVSFTASLSIHNILDLSHIISFMLQAYVPLWVSLLMTKVFSFFSFFIFAAFLFMARVYVGH
jgi:hypothetical protein